MPRQHIWSDRDKNLREDRDTSAHLNCRACGRDGFLIAAKGHTGAIYDTDTGRTLDREPCPRT